MLFEEGDYVFSPKSAVRSSSVAESNTEVLRGEPRIIVVGFGARAYYAAADDQQAFPTREGYRALY